MASLLFALALFAGAEAHAVPMTPAADSDMAVMGMTPGPNAADCSDCGQHDSMAKADCKATCISVFVLAPDAEIEKQGHMDLLSMWESDRAASRETAPDTTPPRS